MNNCAIDDNSSLYVEVDPTGRYGRYSEILGKGASKIVYKGFDEYKGVEVAWNQVKLSDFLQRPEDLERLYREIHLLKTLNHKNIITFYSSWIDTAKTNINFVTEMFNSGTLRQYRLKHKKVNIRAVKQWCRQILEGLLYLHNHEPPVIHRDLKCDNIFINGNQGQVKIGDLGLAAILRKSHAAHCVGTPEFMAPEVYSEEYNELADIYSFGMCILEMVTLEYPYSECTHPAQIYKKVTTGEKPEALYKVNDPEVRFFVEKCLASVSERPSARELLDHPFLRVDDLGKEMWVTNREDYFDKVDRVLQLPDQNEDRSVNTDITINGKRKEGGDIFLRLKIRDREGQTRYIYFPFDTEIDTALSVAAEMVTELEIDDQYVTRIADMIDSEISSLVPSWKTMIIDGYESNAPETNTVESNSNPLLHCSSHGSSSMKGRFEEITADNYGIDYRDKLPHHNRRPSFGFHGLTEFKVDLGTPHNPPASSVVDEIEYENAILKEQIWHKAMQLREQTNKSPSAKLKPPALPTTKKNNEAKRDNKKSSFVSGERGLHVSELKKTLRKHFSYNFPSKFSKKNCIQDAFI